jgi:membrane protease YdiL (CAAX protease family)
MRSLDDTARKTWIKILGIYILHLLFSFQNYSFLYINEKVASIWAWIDPKYLVEFLVVGLIGCVCLCRQRVKEFSSNIFNRESLILLLVNVVFILFIIIIGKTIGGYEINWIGVLCSSIFHYVFVGITEEWIYRGFFVTQMKKAVNNETLVVIGSAVLFSLMHLPSYLMYTEIITFGGVVYRLLIPLLMGLVYANIYLCNGNLFVLVLLHGSYNLIDSVTIDSWYYVSYGIFWLLMLAYSIYCNRIKAKSNKEVY